MTTQNDGASGDHDRILDRLTAILMDVERARALWLSGSFGRGTEDDWSDFDLHLAVADDHFDAWLDERNAIYHRIGTPVLIRPDKPSNTGPGPFQGVIFSGPVCLDFNVYPASLANPGLDVRVLLDRLPLPEYVPAPIDRADRAARVGHSLGLFWAMTLIVLKYVARGNTHRAVTQLDLPLGAFVNAWRLVNAPERLEAGSAHWLHPVHDADLRARLPRLGETISRRDILDAVSCLMQEMAAIEPACAALGAVIPTDVAAETRRLRDAILAELDESDKLTPGADHDER